MKPAMPLFAKILAWFFLNMIVVAAILAVFFVLTRVLLIYSAARLASDLVPESRTAPLLAALLMALGPYPILGDGTLVHDFLFASSERSLHVCNAPSPAATSAMPIGAYICDRLDEKLNCLKSNTSH